MFTNTDARIRPDLMQVVEEAAAADEFFVSDVVLPVKFSKRSQGEFHKLTKSKTESMRSDLGDATLRAPKTAFKKVDRTFEKDTYTCKERGLEEEIDDTDAAETAPSFDAQVISAKLVLRNLRIAQEKRTSDLFMNSSTFGTVAAVVAYTEANITTIDVAKDVIGAIGRVNKRGERANCVIMNWQVWERIRRTKLLREYFFGANGGNQVITRQMFESIFSEAGRIRLIVAEASYDTAKKGATTSDSTLDYIWPATYVWVGRIAPQGDTPEARMSFRTAPVNENGNPAVLTLPDGGVGANIVWEQRANALYITETYRNESIVSDVVRVRQHQVEKVFNAAAGTLITTNFA